MSDKIFIIPTGTKPLKMVYEDSPMVNDENFVKMEKAKLESKLLQYEFEKAQQKQIEYILKLMQISTI